ncbi:MAG TPA: T9SS type A sorting domain-containing protein, partial [Bacteroidia bacterium]|nr:T9SS type A sorting domain-containing protein [Bacteroidia bacterium]
SYVGAAGDFVAMRFDTLGSLDLLFNNMIGFNITSFGNPSGANAVAIQQPDSKIILAGLAVVGTVNNFAMARYTSDFTFVGLNELNTSHSKLQMMPNPASDFVAIESSTPYNRIEIKDITGKVVKVVTPGSLIRSYSLDVKNYSSGVYTATVYFDTGIKVQKFIVANSINN